MRNILRLKYIIVLLALSIAPGKIAQAKEDNKSGDPFHWWKSYRNVKSDPESIWTGEDLSSAEKGTVSIFDYRLERDKKIYVVSQIWNDNCSIKYCPTKLVAIDGNGSKKLLVSDMMYQVLPEDEPDFEKEKADPLTKKFATAPFRLSNNGRTLLNGDFKFEIGK